MRALILSVTFLAASISQSATAADAGHALWNGHDFSGWRVVSEPGLTIESVCSLPGDGVMRVAGKPIGYLTTSVDTYKDFRLHVEWRWVDKPGNGGVLLHIASGPKDRQWPLCFQVQLKQTRAGDVLPMAGAACAELTAPDAKQVDRRAGSSDRPPGEWNVCDVVCRGDAIECTINGVLQNRVTRCTPSSGAIGFQLEGTPFDLRNIRIAPLE